MATDAWLAEACADVDTSSMSGSGAMSEDAGRLSDALSMIGGILGCVMDGDGGCGKYEGATKDYGEGLQNIMGPGVVLAGLVLVVLLPLWISRCCAHKCCAPSRPAGSKERGLAGGCCSFCGAGVVAACLVGIMCVAQVAKGAQDAMCTAHASLDVLELKMREVDTAIDATRSETDEFVQSLDPFIASVSELANAYGTGGNMSVACAELQIVSDGVANLSSIVSSDSTEWTALNATLAQGIAEACVSLREQVEAPAAAAVDDLEGAQADARALYDNIPDLQEFESAADEVRSIDDSLTDAMHDSWDHLSGETASGVGVAVFGVPLMLLIGACLGGERPRPHPRPRRFCCPRAPLPLPPPSPAPTAYRPLRVRAPAIAALCMAASKGGGGGMLNGCGVCLSGCAWVGASVWAAVAFFLGAVLLTGGVVVFDSTTTMHNLDGDLTPLLGATRCAAPYNEPFRASGATLGLSWYADVDGDGVEDGTLPMCEMVAGCFGNATSLTPWVEAAFNVTLDATQLNATVNAAIATGGVTTIDPAVVLGANGQMTSAQAQHAALLADVGPLCGGCAPGSELHDEITRQLAEMGPHLDTAAACVADMVRDVGAVAGGVGTTLGAAADVVDSIVALNAAFECGWMRPAYLPPWGPLRGDVAGGVAGLGLALLTCGAAVLMLVCGVIPVQIYCGGVGREAGCPAACRCCCPAGGGGARMGSTSKGNKMPQQLEVVEGTVITV